MMSEFKPGDKVTIDRFLLTGSVWTIRDKWGSEKAGYEYSMVENGIIRQLLGYEFGTKVMFSEDVMKPVEMRIAGIEWDEMMEGLKGIGSGIWIRKSLRLREKSNPDLRESLSFCRSRGG